MAVMIMIMSTMVITVVITVAIKVKALMLISLMVICLGMTKTIQSSIGFSWTWRLFAHWVEHALCACTMSVRWTLLRAVCMIRWVVAAGASGECSGGSVRIAVLLIFCLLVLTDVLTDVLTGVLTGVLFIYAPSKAVACSILLLLLLLPFVSPIHSLFPIFSYMFHAPNIAVANRLVTSNPACMVVAVLVFFVIVAIMVLLTVTPIIMMAVVVVGMMVMAGSGTGVVTCRGVQSRVTRRTGRLQ